MNSRTALKAASRIDAALQQTLGEGIDLGRMLDDKLYRRDVLLVCEALGPGELPRLAQEFKTVLHAAQTAQTAQQGAERAPKNTSRANGAHRNDSSPGSSDPGHSARSGPDSGGFSPSRFFNSLFGAWGGSQDTADSAVRQPSRTRRSGK